MTAYATTDFLLLDTLCRTIEVVLYERSSLALLGMELFGPELHRTLRGEDGDSVASFFTRSLLPLLPALRSIVLFIVLALHVTACTKEPISFPGPHALRLACGKDSFWTLFLRDTLRYLYLATLLATLLYFSLLFPKVVVTPNAFF